MTGHDVRSAIRPPKLVIGLVGGIGSGKSQVAALFAARGARVISGDAIAHEALRQLELRDRIVQRWGQEMLDENGELRRRALAAVVFANDDERRALEAIVHPWIRRRIREEIARAQADAEVRLIVLDAAIMLEAGWNDVCHHLVFVDAPRSLRLARLAEQRGWTEDEVEAREKAQMPLTKKASHADHVLDNTGTLEHLSRQINDLLCTWGLAPPSGCRTPASRSPREGANAQDPSTP